LTQAAQIQQTEAPPEAGAGAILQYVTFLVDGNSYGVEINLVREIKKWTKPTELPNQPIYNRGVLNLRGTIVPVHDLRSRFGGALTEATEDHVVVIVWIGAKTVGVLVDAVSDIITVQESSIQAVPADQSPGNGQMIGGLVSNEDEMVAILDLNMLFPNEDGESF